MAETSSPQTDPNDAPERQVLPLLELTTGVVLPQMVVTIALETDEAKTAAEAAGPEGRLLLVPRVDGRYARVGTVARVESGGELPNGTEALVLRGLHRAVVGVGVAGSGSALWVETEPVIDPEPPTEKSNELAREYRAVVGAIAERLRSGRLRDAIRGVTDPGALADTAGWWPDLPLERKVALLEELDVEARLEQVVAWARDALAELELSEKIRTDVTDGMEKQQREFLLRQQLSAIRKELGEDGDTDVVGELRTRIAEADLPDAVREAATREVDKLERTGEQSPEHGWIRTWVDTLLDLPWGKTSEDQADVTAARVILDEDHTGLEDVKDRIVEFLAVRRLRAERGITDDAGSRGSGAILALVGPPGVGKTSLGESVARPRTHVHACRAGRRAGRGRDPWTPAHVRRCPAGSPGASADGGRDDEPGHRARRGRQARRGLAG